MTFRQFEFLSATVAVLVAERAEKTFQQSLFALLSLSQSLKFYFDVCLFQLHDLQYEIIQKSNHLEEPFVINIFPLDILNNERNQ